MEQARPEGATPPTGSTPTVSTSTPLRCDERTTRLKLLGNHCGQDRNVSCLGGPQRGFCGDAHPRPSQVLVNLGKDTFDTLTSLGYCGQIASLVEFSCERHEAGAEQTCECTVTLDVSVCCGCRIHFGHHGRVAFALAKRTTRYLDNIIILLSGQQMTPR
jgi:hypothetical protein